MKILIINTVPTERNGITNVIFNLHQAIDNKDVKMDLMTINLPNDNYRLLIEKKGGAVYAVSRLFSSPFKYLRELSKLVRKNNYDIVHIHGNSSTMILDVFGVMLGRCRKVITHCHSTSSNHIYLHHIFKPLLNILISCKVACGYDSGKWLYGKSKFYILTNGVNVEKFRFNKDVREKVRKDLGITPDCFLLGHVGEINENKNQSFIIDILSQLSSFGNYKLVLVGDGPERNNIESKIEDLGLTSRVILTGGVNNPQDYLSVFDIMVMPSKFEGLPLTLVEAQASGLQCVISDTITAEVDLTGTVSFVPLNSGTEQWVDVIRSFEHVDRINQADKNVRSITEKGYNIVSSAKQLVSIYKELV